MGIMKNLRTILPLPSSWKDDERIFGNRLADAISELFRNGMKSDSRIESNENAIDEINTRLDGTLVVKEYTKQDIVFADNSQITIDLSNDIPSGYTLESVLVDVIYKTETPVTHWALPYLSEDCTKGMWVRRVKDNKVIIRNSSTGWGTCDVVITAFLKHT